MEMGDGKETVEREGEDDGEGLADVAGGQRGGDQDVEGVGAGRRSDYLSERGGCEDLLRGRPDDVVVLEGLAVVVVDLEVEVDKTGLRELVLERLELVSRHLLLLGEGDDRELEPLLAQD